MSTIYDPINTITYSRLCNEKARIIRLWKVSSKFDNTKTTYIKMVLMMFENKLEEGKVYVFSNFAIEESTGIYLLNEYIYKISFKKESRKYGQ
ncbi:hypothetical protein Ahy_B03g065328 [Arachis hypogaea]|uniref:DUF223 domain-containing protein n=1 Tax=Arachis hypogaea TaxID=3818 RepID=A0A445A1B4_ARAHY|nr:hypothetical protein Ahy_B03g065328 [Arachis hypogaea]